MEDQILIVDDDESILAMLDMAVKNFGCQAVLVESGEEAIEKLSTGHYALILLDINLKGINGFQVIEYLRNSGQQIPIIVITARQEELDTLYGLQIGADDYITKPFNPVVLAAKAKALIRRSQYQNPAEQLTVGPFTYQISTLRLFKNGTEIDLTSRENAIMKLFLDNVSRIFSKEMIYELVWGDAQTDDNAVMVYINRLRAKIEDDPSSPKYIQNIRGIGYRFVVPELP